MGKQIIKITTAAFVSVGVGLLLNLSAAEINPEYAPNILRWGWFIVTCGFAVYVARAVGFFNRVYISWIQTGSRPLWCVGAAVSICICLGAVYLGISALWDRIGVKHNATSIAHEIAPEQHLPHFSDLPAPTVEPRPRAGISKPMPSSSKKDSRLHEPTAVAVPQIKIATDQGLTLSDFPGGRITADMASHLRRQSLIITNPNQVDFLDFAMRFQFPEPVVFGLIRDASPSGVDIEWHACRVSSSFVGDGAVERSPKGDIVVSTGSGKNSAAVIVGHGEVCASSMDGEERPPTGLYRLQISRIPSMTSIHLAFMTSNGPEAELYSRATDQKPGRLGDGALNYYGDGRVQFNSEQNRIDTIDLFLPLYFDQQYRVIRSDPVSSEHGKWKINLILALE